MSAARVGLAAPVALGMVLLGVVSAGHQRVWPPLEQTKTTQQDYPVVLYDEV